MIQHHISNKEISGVVKLNKNIMADLADLIRLSPTSCRILFLFMAYADDENAVITDIHTISKLLGVEKKNVEASLRTLIKNGYVEMSEVKLQHENAIIGAVHDKNLYEASHRTEWKVVGERFVTNIKLHGTYNRFYINDNIAKCASGQHNNVIKRIGKNLFYDKRLLTSEILWEM